MRLPKLIATLLLVLLARSPYLTSAHAETCRNAAHDLNRQLSPRINEQELTGILDTLNSTGNRHLPPKFVTKREAKELGWRPGSDLWALPALDGSSIGGDRFGNREARLPSGRWREADLDYHGGRRGAKRLIYSDDGRRFVTVDHYRTFHEVPPCR